MSNADAPEPDRHRLAARARWWDREGDPVLSRAVTTVVERRANLDDSQRAAIEAAITGEAGDE